MLLLVENLPLSTKIFSVSKYRDIRELHFFDRHTQLNDSFRILLILYDLSLPTNKLWDLHVIQTSFLPSGSLIQNNFDLSAEDSSFILPTWSERVIAAISQSKRLFVSAFCAFIYLLIVFFYFNGNRSDSNMYTNLGSSFALEYWICWNLGISRLFDMSALFVDSTCPHSSSIIDMFAFWPDRWLFDTLEPF